MEDVTTSPEQILATQSMQICERSGLLICKSKCNAGLEAKEKTLRYHLSTFHNNIDAPTIKKIIESAAALAARATAPGLKKQYIEGGSHHGASPQIEGLSVLSGRLCKHCNKIFGNTETFRTHLSRKHNKYRLSAVEIESHPSVRCQSLSGKPPRMALFMISGANSKNSHTDDEEEEYDPGSVLTCSTFQTDDCFKSPFVSMARVTERFSQAGLNLKKIHLLTSRSSHWIKSLPSSWTENVKDAILGHFNEASDLANDSAQFRNITVAVQTSGIRGKNRSFQFLTNERTRTRYVTHVFHVVRIACLVAAHESELQDVYVSPSLKKLAMDLLQWNAEKDLTELSRLLYDLLWGVFSEKK